MSIRIFITGGSGFIGTNIVGYYAQKGYEICSFDIKEPQCQDHRKYYVQGDILNEIDLTEAMRCFAPTHVLHLAARTDLDETVGIEEYSENTEGVKNIIKAVNSCSGIRKVIFASTMLVCKPGYIPQKTDDYYPSTIYGQSKVEGEKIVRSRDINADWLIFRPTSIWGEWFDIPYVNFFEAVLSSRFFSFASLKKIRKTYCYVYNAVLQIDDLLFSEEYRNTNVYYLGDGYYDINEWANEIAKEANKGRIVSLPNFIPRILGYLGDFLKKFGISFPLTSFRYKNMTTDNRVDLSWTKKIESSFVHRKVGVKNAILWMCNHKK